MTDAAGYSRLSQESDTSIARQQRHIREYCEENDLTLLTIHDDGEQASGFDADRSAYQTLRERIQAGELDAVVVNDKRRLARDIDEVMRLVPLLRSTDTELHTHRDGRLDLSDPMRAAIEILMAAAAHEEKMAEIEKSIEAIEEKQERGDDLGRPRFGMRYSADGRRQVPGENFDVVLDILTLRNRGLTYEEIRERTGVALGTISNVLDRREWYVERERLAES
jgi:DNA invertase Pin-like site-specific DNA recombinase